MTYILFVIYFTYGTNKGLAISQFKTKEACETVLKEAKSYWSVSNNSSCLEIKDTK